MQVDPSVALRTLREEYRAACAASNDIMAAVGDPATAVTRNGKERESPRDFQSADRLAWAPPTHPLGAHPLIGA
jgi:hypothetical protein